MIVYGIATQRRKVEGVAYSYGPEDLRQVLKEVDYLILVVPDTPQTRNMIGTKELSAMKPSAYLINLARGGIVDERALIQALEVGKIAGAALDVFCEEPLPKNHPLWGFKNAIITPHIGGLSDIYVEQSLSIFEENLRLFLRGDKKNLINLVEW